MNVDRPRWFETRWRWWILAGIVLWILNGFRLAFDEWGAIS